MYTRRWLLLINVTASLFLLVLFNFSLYRAAVPRLLSYVFTVFYVCALWSFFRDAPALYHFAMVILPFALLKKHCRQSLTFCEAFTFTSIVSLFAWFFLESALSADYRTYIAGYNKLNILAFSPWFCTVAILTAAGLLKLLIRNNKLVGFVAVVLGKVWTFHIIK